MILAGLEVYHSRPIAPTRRLALGDSLLPVEPAPGLGGILLGGIVAATIGDIDPDLHGDLIRLTIQIEKGQRIPQPRLRHRFQSDRVGLLRSHHWLVNDDGGMSFEIADDGRATPVVHALAAVYAAGLLEPGPRRVVMNVLRKAVRWHGPIGPALIAYLSGQRGAASWSADAFEAPDVWARRILGLQADEGLGRKVVQQRFRALLRDAHPDHGGDDDDAAARITELTEARRILLG